ncbi:MAG: ATP-binding protein, partial [Maribacter dokdonensis]
MKHVEFSDFLHFLICAIFTFFFASKLNAQISKDSSLHYRKAILNPSQPQDLPSGVHYFTKKKERDIESKDTLNAIYDLRLLSIAEFKIGNNFSSENHIVEALNLIESMQTKDTLINSRVGLYNQLGRIYRASNNATEAIRTFDNALQIANKLSDSVIILNNKANIYKDLL